MLDAPKGLRLSIGIYGRRNAGKSSLLNALTGQAAAIVSETPGTTADPVEKTLEMAPLGPVVFIDTAGVDDSGDLGELRKARTFQTMDRADLAILACAEAGWGEYEDALAAMLDERGVPFLAVFNKADAVEADPERMRALRLSLRPAVAASALHGQGMEAIREALVRLAPKDWFAPPRLLGDLLSAGDLAVLIVPIDLGAPKGRLILPQVQAIRDVLDSDAYCVTVKERELREAYARMNRPPALAVCDSQVVLKAAADTPPDVPLTTFSILMARFKGDLPVLARGAAAIETLSPGDRVLIAEGCSHHPLADDIGRVKIPRWLRQYAGGAIVTEICAGKDFPEDLSPYRLVIHCGACTLNRANMLARMYRAQSQDVPITNYGVAISFLQGVLPRTLASFPAALAAFETAFRRAAETKDAAPAYGAEAGRMA